MIHMKPFIYPQVLLLGNGLNRTYGSNCWEDLMGKLLFGMTCPKN